MLELGILVSQGLLMRKGVLLLLGPRSPLEELVGLNAKLLACGTTAGTVGERQVPGLGNVWKVLRSPIRRSKSAQDAHLHPVTFAFSPIFALSGLRSSTVQTKPSSWK